MPPRNRNAHHQSKSNRSIVNDHDVETDPEPERVDGPESAPSSPVSEIQASKPSQLTMQIAAQSATPMTAPGHVPAPSPPPPSRTAGHSRAPVLAREPTAFQSLTRTLRSYVPSSVPLSIPIPISAPSPPAVSRPVSFGSFTQPRTGVHNHANSDRKFDGGVFASDEDLEGMGYAASTDGVYPSPGGSDHGTDEVVWSKWETVDERLHLLLGYHSGMQIWDCSDLRNVQEVFNIKTPRIRYASVLSCTIRKANAGDYPLLGMITSNDNEDSFTIYSLARHHIIHSFTISGLYYFESSASGHIVLSSVNPPTIHIFASSNLTTLHIIPSTQLSFFTPKKSQHRHHSVFVDQLHPVFALHRRLLAYVSSQPSYFPHSGPAVPAQSSPYNTGSSPESSNAGFSHTNPRFSIPITQAELGNAAYKVGGTVFTGMMSLGGMALSAASKAGEQVRARANSAFTDPSPPNPFHARSAPSATHHEDWRRSSPFGTSASPPSTAPKHTTLTNPDVSGIFILDLANLDEHSTTPVPLLHSSVTKHQGIQALRFTADGTSLIVSPQDGQILRIFSIQPSRLAQVSERPHIGADLRQLYNFHRGRTSASIDQVQSTDDGRWVAAATGNRTIHVFPSNPYGGKPDIRSHLESKVMNTVQLRPPVTDVYPVVRVRLPKSPTPERMHAPVSFTFLRPGSGLLPTHLLPPVITSSPYLRPSSGSDDVGSLPEPISPRYRSRSRNYQDLLVFEPIEGALSLRRFTVELKAGDGTFSSGSSHNSTNTANRTSSSPRMSVLSQMMEPSSEFSGKESTIATWPLARSHDWPEVKEPYAMNSTNVPPTVQGHPTTNRWLASAELTTCSPSQRVLPRSLYLAHQFSFYTLGEDYHALIRQYRLGTSGEKLDVRREVEISANGGSGGSTFAEGFQESRTTSVPRSFDEPLASALRAELDHSHVPSVLPMLPNGPGSAKPMSLRNAIPIRSVAIGFSDGMSEGLGRIRREMQRARSPRSPTYISPRTQDSVPLEFDEMEEDFVLDGSAPAVGSHDVDELDDDQVPRSAHSQSPSNRDSTPEEQPVTPTTADVWEGWESADKKIIDDAERFDDITVVGFLEEEQEELMEAQKEREKEVVREVSRSSKPGRKKGRGSKKT